MDSTNFDKMFNRKAAEYLNANGKKDDDLMEREVRIPEHMLPKKIVLDDVLQRQYKNQLVVAQKFCIKFDPLPPVTKNNSPKDPK